MQSWTRGGCSPLSGDNAEPSVSSVLLGTHKEGERTPHTSVFWKMGSCKKLPHLIQKDSHGDPLFIQGKARYCPPTPKPHFRLTVIRGPACPNDHAEQVLVGQTLVQPLDFPLNFGLLHPSQHTDP